MHTGYKTTYTLLDRGTEDVELLAELNKIIGATKIAGSKEFAEKYPRILELKQGLEYERQHA